MKLIVGLGNFGGNYDGTRHNYGFFVINKMAEKFGVSGMWQEKVKFKSIQTQTVIEDQNVILMRPTTYYNLSGEAVQAVKNFYKLENKDILVVHDELDLPFGTLRVRNGGSSAGNNGIKNISQMIGEDYTRIRLGIQNELLTNYNAAEFVLDKFKPEEEVELDQTAEQAIEYIEKYALGTNLENQTVSQLGN